MAHRGVPNSLHANIPAGLGFRIRLDNGRAGIAMSIERQPAVYILASRRQGTLYVGVTSDLIKRAWQHRNETLGGFTARYGVHKLAFFELHSTMEAAITFGPRSLAWTSNGRRDATQGGTAAFVDSGFRRNDDVVAHGLRLAQPAGRPLRFSRTAVRLRGNDEVVSEALGLTRCDSRPRFPGPPAFRPDCSNRNNNHLSRPPNAHVMDQSARRALRRPALARTRGFSPQRPTAA